MPAFTHVSRRFDVDNSEFVVVVDHNGAILREWPVANNGHQVLEAAREYASEMDAFISLDR